jgi:hypothetical protein
MRIISPKRASDDEDDAMEGGEDTSTQVDNDHRFNTALSFAVRTYEIVLQRWGDMNTLPCLHVTLVFIYYMTKHPKAMALLEDKLPWKLFATMLNFLLDNSKFGPRIDATKFPGPGKQQPVAAPLPEDYALRGLLYADDYFPDDWFDTAPKDLEERYFQAPSQVIPRQERLLWIGRRISVQKKWLLWNKQTRKFLVPSKYDVEIENVVKVATQPEESAMTPVDAEFMDTSE